MTDFIYFAQGVILTPDRDFDERGRRPHQPLTRGLSWRDKVYAERAHRLRDFGMRPADIEIGRRAFALSGLLNDGHQTVPAFRLAEARGDVVDPEPVGERRMVERQRLHVDLVKRIAPVIRPGRRFRQPRDHDV